MQGKVLENSLLKGKITFYWLLAGITCQNLGTSNNKETKKPYRNKQLVFRGDWEKKIWVLFGFNPLVFNTRTLNNCSPALVVSDALNSVPEEASQQFEHASLL